MKEGSRGTKEKRHHKQRNEPIKGTRNGIGGFGHGVAGVYIEKEINIVKL